MKKIIAIFIIVGISLSFTTSKRVDALIKKEISSVFNIETFTKEAFVISSEVNNELPIKINDTNFFKIIHENAVIGYYYFGKAYGKADFFDFIVIFDNELIVSKVKVVTYREDHGGEVGSKRWLKQFIGTSSEKKLEYQEDIVGISGATISVKSMMNEVNKLLQTVTILNNKQQL
ncbi:FMN-binding domain-containing protein [Lutibacter agarilyticus]|uniref:FMN-binding domain-containing protein n=1 Tax=Lutibacter agarilyticus TaxID=1109740 RepID=A0A238VIC9_9FLAO|nr:FMN-binding protein [Lutibacter agarilyticus]SNR33249.1 FMN-binding domain-containing protein [Lutibacter agarilyticus]